MNRDDTTVVKYMANTKMSHVSKLEITDEGMQEFTLSNGTRIRKRTKHSKIFKKESEAFNHILRFRKEELEEARQNLLELEIETKELMKKAMQAEIEEREHLVTPPDVEIRQARC